MYVCVYVRMCMYVCMYVRMYVYVYISMCVCVYMYIYVCRIYMFMYVCKYVCMCCLLIPAACQAYPNSTVAQLYESRNFSLCKIVYSLPPYFLLISNICLSPFLKTLIHYAVLAKRNTICHSRNWLAGDEHTFTDVSVLLDCEAAPLAIWFAEF
jgi:hypothetical protein